MEMNDGVTDTTLTQDDKAVIHTSFERSTIERMLLLEDGTLKQLPSHIHQVFEALQHIRPTKMHILKALTYIISLESGFRPCEERIDIFNRMNGCFNISQVRESIHFISEIPQDETVLLKLVLREHRCENTYNLLLREIGDALCITFSNKHHQGKSIYLSASRYVLNANLKVLCLNNLKELSYKLKEYIFTPIRNISLQTNNENATFAGLTGLPSEVIWLIFDRLDKNTLRYKLKKSCKQMEREVNGYLPKLK